MVLKGGSTQATQLTDSKGEFTFSGVLGDPFVLEVSAAGFRDQKVEWHAGTNRVEIVLMPATAAEQVTVTANRTRTQFMETPTNVVVLAPSDLAATTALATDDMLRQVPGFSLFRRTSSRAANPTSQGTSLRGLGGSGASRALVLADGFPVNDPFGGWVYWDRVPRADISSIEVASGGASHLYGSDALGGVINILRRPVASDAFSLETAYGNEKTPDLSFAGSKQIGQWSGTIDGDFYRSDGYIAVPGDLRGSVDTPVDSEHASGDLTLSRRFSNRASVFARGSLFGESRENGTPLQVNSTTVRELDLGGNWASGQVGLFNLHLYVSRQGFYQTFSSIATDRNSESLTRNQHVPAQRVGFSAQWSRSLGTHQNLVAGLEEWNVHGESDEAGFFQGNVSSRLHTGGREANWGGYLEDIVHLSSRWLLNLSGRVDHWQNFDAFSAATAPGLPFGPLAFTPIPDRSETFFSPRLAILRRLTNNVSLTASGYRSFRAPTLNELYRSFRVGNVVTKANNELRAERLTGAEAGAIVTAQDQRFMLRGDFFWAGINRPIANVTIQTTPTLITRQRQNLGSTRSQGVEIEASERLSGSWTISGGYEYTNATVTSYPADPTLNPTLVGLDVPQVPRNQFTFQGSYTKPFLQLGVQGRFVGNQFDDDQNTLLLRRYFTVDAMVSHPLRPGIEIFAAVENMFNRRYDVGRTPVLSVGPPILARAGLRLQFGGR